jgi:hypothetical protein
MKAEQPLFKVGDVITIPRDQYGHPYYAVDPVTRQVGEPKRLREFVVVSVEPVVLKPRP